MREGLSYDLDSLANNWNTLSNHVWVRQNIQYFPGAPKGTGLGLANSPVTDVLMGTKGRWTYADCVHARWDLSYKNNPNNTGSAAIEVGHGICFRTQDTVSKTDGGHYVLLVVRTRTKTTLTLAVTVMERVDEDSESMGLELTGQAPARRPDSSRFAALNANVYDTYHHYGLGRYVS